MPDPESTVAQELDWGIHLLGDVGKPTALQRRVTQAFLVFRKPIFRYLARTLHDPTEAEDLSQEVFLRLFAELRKRGEVKNIRAWLFRVAHNLVADRQRKFGLEQHDAEARLEPSWESSTEDPEQGALNREKERRLETAVSLLSPQERRCLELRAEGLRYREIAEVLSIRTSTVETFLARAIRKIVKELDA